MDSTVCSAKGSSQLPLIRLDIFVDESEQDAVTGILVRKISYGWEEKTLPTGKTQFTVYLDNATLLDQFDAELRLRVPEVQLQRTNVPRQDWTTAWREFFTPVEAGPFLILPPWLEKSTPKGDHKVILIEPKSAFGTGHHESTTLCLKSIGRLADPAQTKYPLQAGMRFFDIGTGTGILGLACTLLGLSGIGADIDPVAITNAQENIALNHAHGLSVFAGSVEIGGEEKFDLVLANILAGPLCELAPQIMDKVKPHGKLILSGLLVHQGDIVEKAYAALGSAKRYISGEWIALVWD